MNTTRDADDADHADHADHTADTGRAAPSGAGEGEESEVTAATPAETFADEPATTSDRPATAQDTGTTSVYVRRGRTPALGFWVAVLIGAPMVIALVISPFLTLQDASSMVSFVLVVGVFVGIPLAAVAAAIDAVRHRRGGPRRR